MKFKSIWMEKITLNSKPWRKYKCLISISAIYCNFYNFVLLGKTFNVKKKKNKIKAISMCTLKYSKQNRLNISIFLKFKIIKKNKMVKLNKCKSIVVFFQ